MLGLYIAYSTGPIAGLYIAVDQSRSCADIRPTRYVTIVYYCILCNAFQAQ